MFWNVTQFPAVMGFLLLCQSDVPSASEKTTRHKKGKSGTRHEDTDGGGNRERRAREGTEGERGNSERIKKKGNGAGDRSRG